MITTGRPINALLGEGDSRRWRLLGGSNGVAGDVVLFGQGRGRFFPNAKDRILQAAYPGSFLPDGTREPAGCVHVDSWLPGNLRAGEVLVGDRLLLIDGSEGEVTYSETKRARLYRILTASGVSLVCSDTAPIPVRGGGYRTPDALMGHEMRPRVDGALADWDAIADVQALGDGDVQHITVGDACFWAGEHRGAYLPHHNSKYPEVNPENPGNYDWTGRRGSR